MDVITDDAGQVEEKLSFDAFGKRRAVFKSNNQAVNFTLASILSLTHKGYTGHEQVDHASVVQMGGRIYDKIARSNFERYVSNGPAGARRMDAPSTPTLAAFYKPTHSYKARAIARTLTATVMYSTTP